MDWVDNKCGGARFRTLPDFRVEVEGFGVPSLAPGTPRYKLLEQTWKNWGSLIRKYAKDRGIPASHILAIMTQETGHLSGDKAKQAAAGSPAGAEGLMQIMPCKIFNPQSELGKMICGADRKDPETSVKIGSRLLQMHLTSRKGLPAAASNYNSGNLTCYKGVHEKNVFNWHHEQNYAYKVTEYNNAAVDMGVNNSGPDLPMWSYGVVGALLATCALWLAKVAR